MKARTNSAIAVSLNALWARNEAARKGRPASEAAATRGTGRRRHRSDSAARPVSAGMAISRPLNASTSDAPVASAMTATSDCGPTG